MRAILVLFLAASCGDSGNKKCSGVPDGGAAGEVTIAAGGDTFGYGHLTWGENNDCPASGSQIVSVTISGAQTRPEAVGFGIGLCLPRPDRVGSAPVSLSDTSLVQLVGASGSGGGCVIAPSSGAAPSGTVTFTGFCTTAGESFMMTLAGSVSGTRTCGDAGVPQAVTLALAGTALVVPRP
jgi:hypothetical protein